MGYFEDIINLFRLKDETYQKISGDKNAFKKYNILYFVIHYIIFFFFSIGRTPAICPITFTIS